MKVRQAQHQAIHAANPYNIWATLHGENVKPLPIGGLVSKQNAEDVMKFGPDVANIFKIGRLKTAQEGAELLVREISKHYVKQAIEQDKQNEEQCGLVIRAGI